MRLNKSSKITKESIIVLVSENKISTTSILYIDQKKNQPTKIFTIKKITGGYDKLPKIDT